MVYCDFDGVLLDFCGALHDSLKKRGVNYIVENTETYDFRGKSGVPRQEIFNEMYNVTMYHNLKFFDGALEALEKLKAYTEVYSYTGSVNHPEIVEIRNKLIKKLELKGTAYVGVSKPILLDSDAVFEDELNKLIEYAKNDYKGKLFLIKHTYNNFSDENIMYSNQIIVCNNFAEAVDRYIFNDEME